mgnify:CR=1 FL=1
MYFSGASITARAVTETADAGRCNSKLEKGLELLEGLDGCEAFTLLQLDADNTGATVE